MAKLAMAAANLLVSCPLAFKVGTFSMKYKFTILFLCGDSRYTGPASLVLNFLDPPAIGISFTADLLPKPRDEDYNPADIEL